MIANLADMDAAPVPVLPGDYAPPPGVFDELFPASGEVRPHCQKFAEHLNEVGARELAERWQEADRWIFENGMAQGVLGGGETVSRPWGLDPLPLVFSQAEWKELAAGLVQRAQVLNLLLADLYGPQLLLRRKILPPEILFGHPAFMRPVHGLSVPENRYLWIYSADLVRGSDGKWQVVADRTDAPFGAGYALENRIVVSRMLPSVFHECRVERLAGYFLAMRESLRRLAYHNRDNPRIVLLTLGPKHPGYFEDAFLARYLGYTLVEGGDLAVRDDKVTLKTLGGLLQVDVILRRMTDQHCDPLELRGDPALGISGLLQAARVGNVAIANPLGSSLVESPCFVPYLPDLCRELLSNELLLPSLPTYWGGDPEHRQYAADHAGELALRPAFRLRGRHGVGRDATDRTRENLLADLASRPARVVAQKWPEVSSAPTWSEAGLRSARVMLRTYLVATGDTYTVLPGGLVRFANDPAKMEQSVLSGEGSKDAWVLAEGPVKEVSLLRPADQPVELRRSGAELPSRVADNLFWLGRQAERLEGAARLMRTVLTRLTSEVPSGSTAELPLLLRHLADGGQIEPGFVVEGIRDLLPKIEEGLPHSVFDEQQSRSLRSIVSSIYRVASTVRDRISLDSWRIISRIDQDFAAPAQGEHLDLGDVLTKINAMLIDLAAFSGLVMESMTRTQGWRFLDIGRRLERALHTIGLVKGILFASGGQQGHVLDAVLEIADSIMTYRSRYLAQLQTAPVLDLLLTDETNPRSVAYQLAALADHVDHLPRDRTQPLRSPEQRIALTALHGIRTVTAQDLTELTDDPKRGRLGRLIAMLADHLPKLADVIRHRYLIHAGVPRELEQQRSDTHRE